MTLTPDRRRDGDIDRFLAEPVGPDDPRGAEADDERQAREETAAEGSSEAVGVRDTRRRSRHPMLTDAQWSELSRFAPEVLDSITGLTALKNELSCFARPMGPDEAVVLVDAIEALNRINEVLSALTLSVFECVGTPTDYGAKTTKALVQNRLGLTGAEANRRTELAKSVGGRVDITGQALPPLNPQVADGLRDGVLSAGQASVIADCMKRLPAWVSADLRAETEAKLVSEAPRVRVADLREIFQRMLDIIDPDGEEPRDPPDRSKYSVHLRSRRDGSWDLTGRLDVITGGLLNGLLTSRIESCRETSSGGGATDGGPNSSPCGRPAAQSADGADSAATDGAAFGLLDAVLSGDRYDAPLFALDGSDTALVGGAPAASGGGAETSGESTSGFGVREDGAAVSTVDAQPSARAWIYERFATLIGRMEMTRPTSGARYSLVVTAKAEDLDTGSGSAATGAENSVPISEVTSFGLNGRVFFHLMSDEAKTVQVATEQRFANEKQTAVIAARDQGCTFPGCDSPPGWCEVHHIVPWIEGGRTDINNLTLACGAHHHLIDKSDWHAVMLTDGRPAWVPPASIDPERRPILHAKFIAKHIIETLFDI